MCMGFNPYYYCIKNLAKIHLKSCLQHELRGSILIFVFCGSLICTGCQGYEPWRILNPPAALSLSLFHPSICFGLFQFFNQSFHFYSGRRIRIAIFAVVFPGHVCSFSEQTIRTELSTVLQSKAGIIHDTSTFLQSPPRDLNPRFAKRHSSERSYG